MALANCKNTEITAHFRYARKFLLHYRYDAHKPLRERQNAGFFTASLEVVPSQRLSTLHRARLSFIPQRLVLSVFGSACFATFVGACLKGLFFRFSVHGAACFFLGASLRCCCSFCAWLSCAFASTLLLCVKFLFRPCLPYQSFVPLSASPF